MAQNKVGKALVVTTATISEPIVKTSLSFSNFNENVSDNDALRIAQLVAALDPNTVLDSVVIRDDYDIE